MLMLETLYTSYNTDMLCYAMLMLETLNTSYNTGMLCLCYAYAGVMLCLCWERRTRRKRIV